ncbi:MAG: hypothetical protein IJ089_06010, partial [Clostridia bacterium]|nr:hypothetical protein [Clostridia bacterium]
MVFPPAYDETIIAGRSLFGKAGKINSDLSLCDKSVFIIQTPAARHFCRAAGVSGMIYWIWIVLASG